MSSTTKRKDGRKYKVDAGGINSLRRKYQIVMDSTMDSEDISFTSVPAIGSAHPTYSYLTVASYDIEEGEGSEKKTLTVWVNYERSELYVDPTDQTSSWTVDQWGWDASTEQKELTEDAATGSPVVNSAGDPFESVPAVSTYSPVFTKIVKFAARKSGAMAYNCKVNSASITIGDLACPEGTLLCSVEEQRLIGDSNWKYRYIIRLKYKTNKVKIARAETKTEIGWDIAVTDAGMRAIDSNNALARIKALDPETGRSYEVASPELLDGTGHVVSRSSTSTTTPTPYNFRFKAYERADFPAWFYSESDIRDVTSNSN